MKKIVLSNGMLMFGCFAAWFLLMHAFGLSDNYNLRIFNVIAHITFMALAIRQYHRQFNHQGNYLTGVVVGMLTSAVGVGLFTVMMSLFLYFNPTFMAAIRLDNPLGQYLTPFTACLYFLSEGVVVSLIGSYLVVRILEHYSRA